MIYSKLGHIKRTYVFEYKGEMYTVEVEQINPAVFDEGTPNTYTFFETDGTVIEIGDNRIDEMKKQLDVLSGIEEWVYVDEEAD